MDESSWMKRGQEEKLGRFRLFRPERRHVRRNTAAEEMSLFFCMDSVTGLNYKLRTRKSSPWKARRCVGVY